MTRLSAVALHTAEDVASRAERALLLIKAVEPNAAKAIASRMITEQPGGDCCVPLIQLLTTLDGQLHTSPPEKRALALLLCSHALQQKNPGSHLDRAPVPTSGILTPAFQAALLHEQETQQAAAAAGTSDPTTSATADEPRPSINPLLGRSTEGAVEYLVAKLQEADGSGADNNMSEMLGLRLNELGAEVVWETFCESKTMFDSGKFFAPFWQRNATYGSC